MSQTTDQEFLSGNFAFKGTPIDQLMENNYTILQLIVDLSGSVSGFVHLVVRMLKAIVEKLSTIDTSANILVRATSFNSDVGVKEIHGFRLLENIKQDDYDGLTAQGSTPLYGAIDEGIDALDKYGSHLTQKRYKINGINFVLTDGKHNFGDRDPATLLKELAEKQQQFLQSESFDSSTFILIEINKSERDATAMLKLLADKLKFDRFIGIENISDATDSLVNYIVTTTQQTSTLHGTGGKSQAVQDDFNKF